MGLFSDIRHHDASILATTKFVNIFVYKTTPGGYTGAMMRDEFREAVFARDGHKCVVCGLCGIQECADGPVKLDAHHIMERRLWTDGGYHLDNGVTLCAVCHLKAETTELSCEGLRLMAGIAKTILPDHLYPDNIYDKWGNIVLENGRRLRGELFQDGSVQKALEMGGRLSSFVEWVKYPRTFHLPWSPGVGDSDKVLTNLDNFIGQDVVVTVKMDGENTSIYHGGHVHARSLDTERHSSRDWVRSLGARVGCELPVGWRVCGENLWAKHSIHYHALRSYFYAFSIWDANNMCLPWAETVEWAQLLGLDVPNVLWNGLFTPRAIDGVLPWWPDISLADDPIEGYVVRLSRAFSYGELRRCVAKCVRAEHVQTNEHWLNARLIKNELSGSAK